jgi:hypothetical protein
LSRAASAETLNKASSTLPGLHNRLHRTIRRYNRPCSLHGAPSSLRLLTASGPALAHCVSPLRLRLTSIAAVMPDRAAYPTLEPPSIPPQERQHRAYDQYPPGGNFPASAPPGQESARPQPSGRYEPYSAASRPANQPPHDHHHHVHWGSGDDKPLPVQLVLAPFKLANGLFGIACKTVLGPLRMAMGQKIPYSHRRHLVLLPERLETFMGDVTYMQVRFSSHGACCLPCNPCNKACSHVAAYVVACMLPCSVST